MNYEGEKGYLTLMRDIIYHGDEVSSQDDRTGTGYRFLVGQTVKYDIREWTMPLFTTRKIPWKNVVEELLFFLRGDTDTNKLEEKKVRIWSANSSAEFIEKRGLSSVLKPGWIGPMYGFQWRHFGAEYKGADADYKGQGFDQIQFIMDTLKKDPSSRRMLLSAYNPNALEKSVLPPCHFSAQWIVSQGMLHCILNQRSCDLPLGCPTNVASYSLLTFIFCHYAKLNPGSLTHFIGHAHVYSNQIEHAKIHVDRTPTPFPTIEMRDMPDDFEQLNTDNFVLKNYEPQPFIRYPFAT